MTFFFASRILLLALFFFFFFFVWSIHTTAAFSCLSSSSSTVLHPAVSSASSSPAIAQLLLSHNYDDDSNTNALFLLLSLLADDMAAAATAAVFVSPLVAAVDKAITLNAAGQEDLWTSLQSNIMDLFATNPVEYMLWNKNSAVPFRWLWFVYAVTYMAANIADTISTQLLHIPPAIPVLVASTVLNTVACVAKDAAFAKLYGKKQKNDDDDLWKEGGEATSGSSQQQQQQQQSKQVVPAASYAVWLVRDILTAFSAFTLPPLLMESSFHVPALWSRLAGPVVAQYVTTPLHLTGLALYNLPPPPPPVAAAAVANDDMKNNNNKNADCYWRVLIATVQKQFPATVVARQLRILPAFSLGTIANSALREWAHSSIIITTTTT